MMAGVAHSPKFAKKVGVPTKVGKKFNAADKGTGMLRPKKAKAEKVKHRGKNYTMR